MQNHTVVKKDNKGVITTNELKINGTTGNNMDTSQTQIIKKLTSTITSYIKVQYIAIQLSNPK